MPEFHYRVRDSGGRPSSGTLQAGTEREAIQQLQRAGYIVTSLTMKRGRGGDTFAGLKSVKLGGVRLKDLAVFTRQLSAVLSAGLTLAVALDALGKQTANAVLRDTIEAVRLDVSKGLSFSEALTKHPKVFSPLYINSVMAGETGGSLDGVLNRLATSLERDLELTQKVKASLYYPILIVVAAIILIIVMSLFILPTFVDIFVTSGMELPLMTRLLIGFVQNFQKIAPFLLLALVLFIFGYRMLMRDPKMRRKAERFYLRVPLAGNLIRQMLVARLSRTLAMLLSAGVPLMNSLRITSEVVRNMPFRDALGDVSEGVQRGEALGQALSRHQVFPPLLSQMVSVGEETGAVESMLGRLADMYEIEVEATIKGLTALIEPAIIIVLGIGIGFVVASIFLPLVNMIHVL